MRCMRAGNVLLRGDVVVRTGERRQAAGEFVSPRAKHEALDTSAHKTTRTWARAQDASTGDVDSQSRDARNTTIESGVSAAYLFALPPLSNGRQPSILVPGHASACIPKHTGWHKELFASTCAHRKDFHWNGEHYESTGF